MLCLYISCKVLMQFLSLFFVGEQSWGSFWHVSIFPPSSIGILLFWLLKSSFAWGEWMVEDRAAAILQSFSCLLWIICLFVTPSSPCSPAFYSQKDVWNLKKKICSYRFKQVCISYLSQPEASKEISSGLQLRINLVWEWFIIANLW